MIEKAGLLDRYVEEYERDPQYIAEGLAIDLLENAIFIMQQKNLTRAEVARRMGVSRSAVTQLFGRGSHNLTLLTIAKLADAIGSEFRCYVDDGVLGESLQAPALPAADSFGFLKRFLVEMEGIDDAPVQDPTAVAAAA